MESIKKVIVKFKEKAPQNKTREAGEDDKKEEKFGSSLGIVMSCLGCVVGTGNVWRFPRICASNSGAEGSLCFLFVWLIFLFVWSQPLITIEYTLGRFGQCGIIANFRKFMGDRYVWTAGWILCTSSLITAYYAVVVGWCVYYMGLVAVLPALPANEEDSLQLFNDYTESYWPLFTHCLITIFVGLFLFGGINIIEKVNKILVPVLLAIIGFTFIWSLTRPYADVGISFLFTPDWNTLKDPTLWVQAIAQNALDTGAGQGVFATYAAFFTRTDSSVKFGTSIPLANNIVSFICGVTIISTVFSTLVSTNPFYTKMHISMIIKDTGPGATGLTFTWIPVLFSKVGVMGRIICFLFFFCLTIAGATSLLSCLSFINMSIENFGVSKRNSSIIAILFVLIFGIPSSLYLNFLTNQDYAWTYALIISGGLVGFMVIKYGAFAYRKHIVNNYGIGDWKLTKIWPIIVIILIPIQAVGIICWYIYQEIKVDPSWYIPIKTSISCTLFQWLALLIFLLCLNYYLIKSSRMKHLDTEREIEPDPFYYKYEDAKIFSSTSNVQRLEIS